MGGKQSNMSNAQHKALADAGAGCSTVGKTAVVGAQDRAVKQVADGVVSATAKPVLQAFEGFHVADAAVV